MRQRKNREINIFSMSALDLFASGLGAFLVLMILMFPYYKKESDTLAKLAKSQEAVQACQQDLSKAQATVKQCQDKLASTMLIVSMSWQHVGGGSSEHDVDMFIRDPDGNNYYFNARNDPPRSNFPSDARISTDIKQTPGYEVFEDPVARSGTYSIEIALYKKNVSSTQPISVQMKIYTRDGVKELPAVTIRPDSDLGRRIKAATVQIDRSGDIRISQG